jgi:hypothetical protein
MGTIPKFKNKVLINQNTKLEIEDGLLCYNKESKLFSIYIIENIITFTQLDTDIDYCLRTIKTNEIKDYFTGQLFRSDIEMINLNPDYKFKWYLLPTFRILYGK